MNPISRAAALLALAFASAAQAFFIQPNTYVYEYANGYTGHYVLLDAGEANVVQSGAAGPGWEPTGYYFEVVSPQVVYSTQKPVCRFYSAANNSHFFTASAAECESLKDPSSGWAYEKIAFTVSAIPAPDCPAGQKPVYRVYNGRAAQHDVNHRFTPDAAVRDEMIARGWKDEGVAFCTFSWFHQALKTYDVATIAMAPPAECESRVGPCIALKQLPAMANRIYAFLPPFYVNKNPDYPWDTLSITGTVTDLFTAQPASDPAAVARHSFIQMSAGPSYGIHVASGDRLGGPYAAISPMYELPGAAPAAGGTDERVFPFRGPRHHTITASFAVTAPTVKRSDPSSHAYGGLVLQFGDASTGHSFYATVQAYGTVPPGDFTARDADTGTPIVSTVFRADPAFGARLSGDFAACDGSSACIPQPAFYQFRIYDADFAKLLARAREVDPTLSADAASYFIAQFRVQNETYGAAEIGATVHSVRMEVWY